MNPGGAMASEAMSPSGRGFHGISYHIDGKLKLSGEQRTYNGDEYKYRIPYRSKEGG
jgi:hypothetical protein